MAMNVISTIDLDMSKINAIVINAVQNDKSGRIVKIKLYNNGVEWAVPSVAVPAIRYRKSDGIGGFYDTDDTGAEAITYENDRKTVNIILAQQVLTTPGDVRIQVNFYTVSGESVSTFAFRIKVQESCESDSDIISSPYYNALNATIEAALNDLQQLKSFVGAPRKATTAAEMTDPTFIYVYTGDETGYVNGDWYYYDGSDWVVGGVYNAIAFNVDDTLNISGAAADAKATGDAITSQSENIAAITGFMPIKFEKGGYWTTPSSGTPQFVESESWAFARFPMTPNHDTIYINATAGSGTSRLYVYLDENGEAVARSSENLSGEMQITPTRSAVTEIIINNNLASQPSGYYIYKSDFPINIPTLMSSPFINRTNTTITDINAENQPSGFFAWPTSVHPANSPDFVSGKSFTLVNFIIGSESQARSVQIIIQHAETAAESTAWYRFKLSTGWQDWIQFLTPNDLILYWCNGKTINWIGDSIVSGGDFDELVCDALGMEENDYGISGSTIALKGDGTDGRDAIVARYSDMTDEADIIAVSAGTNDWMYAWSPIGDIDSTANTTFYGALKNLCAGLIDKYPDKVIFFMTPIKRAQAFDDGDGGEYTPDDQDTTPFSKNKYGLTLMDYCDIIKEVCGYYSIPVLDMNRESGLNPHLTSQAIYFSDKTHPNSDGRRLMARRVAGWLTQLAYSINT